uniref:Ankyrin repeat and LEM domain containing 1 n=2 Tax=Canis lupus TaxID=9612 RepID=A0A8C0NR87_CANLF
MDAGAGLAQRLRAALREDEPRAVEELLSRGADPNRLLADGAAAMHLAAGARHPRGLRCLEALLRRGGDANARSVEALTPLHVAAAWGCRRGLELLLGHGADPALRDQDGLRPLDLAEQQGHRDCARVLREFQRQRRTRTSTPTGVEREEPDLRLSSLRLLDSLLVQPEIADSDSGLESPPGQWDCSSDTSFVTAIEASRTEDPALDTASGAGSLPRAEQGLLSTGDRDSVPSCWCPLVPAMSDLELLRGLQALGESLGPITPFTRPYHLQRLEEAHQEAAPGHSPELAEALRTGCIPDAQADEDMLTQQFERPDPKRRWREGLIKSSFTYLLMDPRETQDLPARAFSLTQAECLRAFVRAIFYVGKGTRARPDFHLREALRLHRRPGKQACPKVRQILEIWASGRGVVSLHCFQHVIAVEAYTREACLVEALGIQMLTNQKQGHYYGVVANWPATRRRRLGVHLLHRALLVFLAEGERELRPQDIQARG